MENVAKKKRYTKELVRLLAREGERKETDGRGGREFAQLTINVTQSR